MKTGKLTMAAAVLMVAAIPIGVEVVKDDEQQGTVPHAGEAETMAGRLPAKSARAASQTKLTTAERLRAAFERLEAGEELEEELELAVRRLMFTLDASELEAARELLEGVEKVDRFREIAQAVFARWAELDAEAAVAEASREIGRFGYYPLHGAFGTWTVTDSDAALDWLVTAATPFDLKFMGYEWLRRLVRDDAVEAVEALQEIAAGKPEWSETMHWALVDWWARHDPEASLEWVDQFDGQQRQQLLVHFVKAAGYARADIALQAADQIENRGARLEAIWDVVWPWAIEQPDELIRHATAHDIFGSMEPETLRSIGEGLARSRPREVVALGERVAAGLRRDSYWSGVLRGVTEADPAHFVAAAEAISDNFVEREASGDFTHFVRSWFAQDEAAAREWVMALPDGSKRRFAELAVRQGAPLKAGR